MHNKIKIPYFEASSKRYKKMEIVLNQIEKLKNATTATEFQSLANELNNMYNYSKEVRSKYYISVYELLVSVDELVPVYDEDGDFDENKRVNIFKKSF